MKKVDVKIDDEILRFLDNEVKLRNKSISFVVNEILKEKFLKQRKLKAVKETTPSKQK